MSVEPTPISTPQGLAAPAGNPTLPDEKKQCYELVKHNFRNPDLGTTAVVGTVRGLDRAHRAVEVLDGRLKPEEREAGFGHYLQEFKTPIERKPRRPLGRWALGKRFGKRRRRPL
jgi:hypothetical protein